VAVLVWLPGGEFLDVGQYLLLSLGDLCSFSPWESVHSS